MLLVALLVDRRPVNRCGAFLALLQLLLLVDLPVNDTVAPHGATLTSSEQCWKVVLGFPLSLTY